MTARTLIKTHLDTILIGNDSYRTRYYIVPITDDSVRVYANYSGGPLANESVHVANLDGLGTKDCEFVGGFYCTHENYTIGALTTEEEIFAYLHRKNEMGVRNGNA